MTGHKSRSGHQIEKYHKINFSGQDAFTGWSPTTNDYEKLILICPIKVQFVINNMS